MSSEQAFLGYPIQFNRIMIYPPIVKYIITNEDFLFYRKILTITQEEIEDEFIENKKEIDKFPTPLEYLLNIAFNIPELNEKIKGAFKFFLHEPVTFLYNEKKIYVGDLSKIKEMESIKDIDFLSEENYFDFQNKIRESLGEKPIEPPNPNEDPRVKKIKAKARYRDKVKAKEGKTLNLLATLASICCMNFSLNPLNIGELSYAAVQILFNYYQNKEAYDLNMSFIAGGADSKKIHPIYWIKNIED